MSHNLFREIYCHENGKKETEHKMQKQTKRRNREALSLGDIFCLRE